MLRFGLVNTSVTYLSVTENNEEKANSFFNNFYITKDHDTYMTVKKRKGQASDKIISKQIIKFSRIAKNIFTLFNNEHKYTFELNNNSVGLLSDTFESCSLEIDNYWKIGEQKFQMVFEGKEDILIGTRIVRNCARLRWDLEEGEKIFFWIHYKEGLVKNYLKTPPYYTVFMQESHLVEGKCAVFLEQKSKI